MPHPRLRRDAQPGQEDRPEASRRAPPPQPRPVRRRHRRHRGRRDPRRPTAPPRLRRRRPRRRRPLPQRLGPHRTGRGPVRLGLTRKVRQGQGEGEGRGEGRGGRRGRQGRGRRQGCGPGGLLGDRSRCPRHRGRGRRLGRLRRLQLLRRRQWRRLRPDRRLRRRHRPPSGAHRYRNGENAKCLAAPFNSPPTTTDCNGSGTVWAFRPLSDGSFEIVHESGRSCLSSGAGGILLLSCNQDESRRWRTGPGGTLKSVGTGGCLGTVNGSRITTTQCTGSPAQRWTAL
ncbi:ricin-type beta-trefoil lectin domain protein [Streptomyces albus]|nr:ricin-type beta-trefoil lectin domain protein [Streptomyces albus]